MQLLLSSLDDKGLTVQIFLNEDMKKNDYGETVFYKDNDVMCGIHHQPGRVLIWNNTLNHMPKPPSMLYVQTQNYIVLKLSNSEEEYKSCMELNKVGFVQVHIITRTRSCKTCRHKYLSCR